MRRFEHIDRRGIPQGAEQGSCYPNGTCDRGLTCLSNTCVNAGSSGVDGGGAETGAPPTDAAADVARDARDEAGQPCPGATINHPGTDPRNAGTSVPFIGNARDASCSALTGSQLVWTDNLEGTIGTGTTFSHTFTVKGTHTVTLTATDGAGSMFVAIVTFDIV